MQTARPPQAPTPETPQRSLIELKWKDGMIILWDPTQPTLELSYTKLEIAAFIDGAKHGEFDHLFDLMPFPVRTG